MFKKNCFYTAIALFTLTFQNVYTMDYELLLASQKTKIKNFAIGQLEKYCIDYTAKTANSVLYSGASLCFASKKKNIIKLNEEKINQYCTTIKNNKKEPEKCKQSLAEIYQQIPQINDSIELITAISTQALTINKKKEKEDPFESFFYKLWKKAPSLFASLLINTAIKIGIKKVIYTTTEKLFPKTEDDSETKINTKYYGLKLITTMIMLPISKFVGGLTEKFLSSNETKKEWLIEKNEKNICKLAKVFKKRNDTNEWLAQVHGDFQSGYLVIPE